MNINEVIQTGNPYYGPIKHISGQLSLVEWRFPFLAQALVFLISCVVLVILALLYITVRLIAQIGAIFSYLIQQARQDMLGKPTIEQTGYSVAIGVYFLLWAPLWLIQLPLFLVDWLWQGAGLLFADIFVLVAGLIWFTCRQRQKFSYWRSFQG